MNRLSPTHLLPPAGTVFTNVSVSDASVLATVAPIPEPASLAIICLSTTLLLRRHHPRDLLGES